jgi:IS5 family transposase
LIEIARATRADLRQTQARLAKQEDSQSLLWQAKASHYQPLIERIIAQSERRVLKGEQVPASEKIVSLFEPHADIIVKGGRDTSYGHKLNLVTGRSGLVLDVVIEAGNPPDSDRLLPVLEPYRLLRKGAAAGRRRWRLCKPCQSRYG